MHGAALKRQAQAGGGALLARGLLSPRVLQGGRMLLLWLGTELGSTGVNARLELDPALSSPWPCPGCSLHHADAPGARGGCEQGDFIVGHDVLLEQMISPRLPTFCCSIFIINPRRDVLCAVFCFC